MGQACCKPGVKGGDEIAVDHKNVPRTISTSDDDEEAWWDASEELTLESVIEEWQIEQHGSLGTLQAEVDTQLHQGGHLVPANIEAAVSDNGKPHTHPQTHTIHVHHESPPDHHHYLGSALTSSSLLLPHLHALHPAALLPHSWHLHRLEQNTAAIDALRAAREEQDEGRILKARGLVEKAAKLANIPVSELNSICVNCVNGELPLGKSDGVVDNNNSSSINISEILDKATNVQETLAALENDDGWLVSRDKGLRVLYKHIKGTTCHSLKFRAVFNHTPEHIAALAHEFELVPTWNKFCLEALKLAEPTIFDNYVYGCQWMPKPFRHIQVLIRAEAYDLADEHRSLLITINDVKENTASSSGFDLPEGHAPLPEALPQRKLANILQGSCIKIKPLPRDPNDGKDKTEAFLLAHVDPHIPYVPGWLINFVLGILAPYVYNQMKTLLDSFFADPNGPYPTRIREQPEVYGRIRDRMRVYSEEYGWSEDDFVDPSPSDHDQ